MHEQTGSTQLFCRALPLILILVGFHFIFLFPFLYLLNPYFTVHIFFPAIERDDGANAYGGQRNKEYQTQYSQDFLESIHVRINKISGLPNYPSIPWHE